jgi:hypothetical protein
MVETGKYIYCLIEGDARRDFTARNIGEMPSPVYSIHFKDIGAVISETPIINYQLLSRNYLAHQKVIEESLAQVLNPLPVRFATIARNDENIFTIMEKRYTEFKDYFDRLRGKKELGLKVFWDNEVAYDEILQENIWIKTTRDSLQRLPAEKSYFQRIELGKQVEQALNEKRHREGDRILAVLRDQCVDYRIGNIIGDKMVLNASFLVDTLQEQIFDESIARLYEENQQRLNLKYVGPIPPYNFVEISINIVELGLS